MAGKRHGGNRLLVVLDRHDYDYIHANGHRPTSPRVMQFLHRLQLRDASYGYGIMFAMKDLADFRRHCLTSFDMAGLDDTTPSLVVSHVRESINTSIEFMNRIMAE